MNTWRVRILGLIVLVAASLAIAGCFFVDGDDGRAYVRLTWPSDCWLYVDFHTTQFPDSVTRNQYYEHSAGSYAFDYVLEDYYYYYGPYAARYNVTINRGDRSLWGPVDGEDAYFTVDCGKSGPSVSSPSVVSRSTLEGAPEGSYVEETTVGNVVFRLEVIMLESSMDTSSFQRMAE